MQLFVRVVEEGSFSAAARFLGRTPSSVSRQISQLEGELSTRLFNRTTRKQSLTEAGEIYFRHAQRIVADIDEARLAVNRLTDTPSGNLHITVVEDFAVAYIAPILPEFLKQYPEVHIRLSISPGNMDLIESGVDVAIRIGHLEDSSLIARKIGTLSSPICASPSYLKKHGTPKHPNDLEAHNCLSYQTKPGIIHWEFKSPKGSLVVPIEGRINVNSVTILRDMALNGAGIVMIPSWMVTEGINDGKLVSLLEDYPRVPSSTPIHAIFAHNRHLAPKVRAFVDFLKDRMAVA